MKTIKFILALPFIIFGFLTIAVAPTVTNSSDGDGVLILSGIGIMAIGILIIFYGDKKLF